MQEVVQITNGEIRMGPGTLYGTIKRMLEAGFIEETAERFDPLLADQQVQRRRYYRLTNLGTAWHAQKRADCQRRSMSPTPKR